MNVVLDDAEEVYDCSAKAGKEAKPRRELGEFDTPWTFVKSRVVISSMVTFRGWCRVEIRFWVVISIMLEPRRISCGSGPRFGRKRAHQRRIREKRSR